MNTIKKLLQKLARKRKWLMMSVTAMAVACIVLAFPISISTNPNADNAILTVGPGGFTIVIGNTVGAQAANYTCDGIDDNETFQTALDALPAIGGQLLVLAGNYSWAVGETVTRAIDNISIIGVGASVSFSGDGVTAIFTAGGDNWFFGDLRTDAGGLSMGATTDWMWFNLTIDTTYYSVRTDTVELGSTVQGTDVAVSELGAATYDDVQDYINFFGDRTLLSGGAITAHGDADGSVAIAACTAWCKATDSDTAVGTFFDYGGKAKQTLTDLSANAIYLDYNAGTPQIVVAPNYSTYGFQQDHILMGAVFRQGTAVHIFLSANIGIQGINRAFMHQVEHNGAHRTSGLVTTDGGSLGLSISAGVLYAGLNRQVTIVDGSTWSYWYTSDSGSTWTEDTGQSVLVQSYNDIASGKVALTVNRFGVHWVYVDYEGSHLHIVYGQGDYTASQAEEANIPSALPPIVVDYGILIAKIINQEGTNTLTITYPWTTTFTSSLATDHGSLAGLGDDDHLQYIKDSEFSQDSGFLVGTGAGTFTEETGATARTSLGLAIGTDVQAYNANLTSIAALGTAAGRFLYTTGLSTWAEALVTLFGRSLLDDDDAAAARATLELGNVENTTHSTDGHTMTIDGVDVSAHAADGSAHQSNVITITYVIDGGGLAITTGQKGHLEIPFACTITAWTIVADQSGSIVMDVWKDTYANFPPTVADTIAGSEKPTLSSAQSNQDLSLSTWTTAVAAGSVLAFNVDSVATVERITLSIKATKT